MRGMFRKKSKLEVSAVSEVAPWKFALSVCQSLLSLNDVWKLTFPCAIVLTWFWPEASACGRGVQRNVTNTLLHSPSVSIISDSMFLTTIILVFGLAICVCPGMDHPVFSPSLSQISAPPSPDPGFFTSTCLHLLHLLPGVHSSHPASRRLLCISVQCLFLHEAFPPLSTFSRPRQKAASRDGIKLIFVVLWTWESSLGPAIYKLGELGLLLKLHVFHFLYLISIP